MSAPDLEPAASVDGRSLRRERNRDLAIDALLDLLNEGVVRPTAQDVAERSGISLRSIFRIFDDVDTLNTTAVERQLERIRPLFVEVPAEGSLIERIDAITNAHARVYEAIAPVRRAAVRVAADSPGLQRQLARSRTWFRAELERVFAREEPDTDTLAAVELALSWEGWDQMRAQQGMSVANARRSIAAMVATLLA